MIIKCEKCKKENDTNKTTHSSMTKTINWECVFCGYWNLNKKEMDN